MKLIGISGLARSGKDSFYELSKPILKRAKRDCVKFAFADQLKNECDEILSKYTNISAFTEDPEEKKMIRALLVTYGTHIRRKLNPQCWIEKIENEVRKNLSRNKVVFITDVRFENEIDWVHELGGSTVHVSKEGNSAPNQDELKNNPILIKKSKHFIHWDSFNKEDMRKISNNVTKVLSSIL